MENCSQRSVAAAIGLVEGAGRGDALRKGKRKKKNNNKEEERRKKETGEGKKGNKKKKNLA